MKTVRLCVMAIGLVGASLVFVTPTTAAGDDHWPPTSVAKPEPVIPGMPPVPETSVTVLRDGQLDNVEIYDWVRHFVTRAGSNTHRTVGRSTR
jgi:hypothetical protein